MSDFSRFRDLAREGTELQQRVAEISLKQVKLSHAEGIRLAIEAFPKAKIQEVVPLAEIKPSDFAESAENTIAKLKELGQNPSRILIDNRRFVITLLQ